MSVRLPPSRAHIWGSRDGCPGWVLYSQIHKAEKKYSEDQLEGIAAHAVAKIALESIYPPSEVGSNVDGVTVTQEMLDAVNIYVESVFEATSKPIVERRIHCGEIHELCDGDVDCYAIEGDEIPVFDFKYGRSKTSAFENWQFICYAAGILELPNTHENPTFVFHLVQPRAYKSCGPIDMWRISAKDLEPYFRILRANAIKAFSSQPGFRSGSHCRTCPARFTCEASLSACSTLYEASTESLPATITPEMAGNQLRIVSRARKHLQEIETQLTAVVKKALVSSPVSGWALKNSNGTLEWSLGAEDIKKLGESLGISLVKPDTLFTPTKALSFAGIDKEKILSHTRRSRPVAKLIRDDGTKTQGNP